MYHGLLGPHGPGRLHLPVLDHHLAHPGDGHPRTPAHQEGPVDPVRGLHHLGGDPVPGRDRHPAVGTVPVDLEPLGVPGVHAVGGHELVGLALGGPGHTADGDEADGGAADVGDREGPAEVGGGHLLLPWLRLLVPYLFIVPSAAWVARELRARDPPAHRSAVPGPGSASPAPSSGRPTGPGRSQGTEPAAPTWAATRSRTRSRPASLGRSHPAQRRHGPACCPASPGSAAGARPARGLQVPAPRGTRGRQPRGGPRQGSARPSGWTSCPHPCGRRRDRPGGRSGTR